MGEAMPKVLWSQMNLENFHGNRDRNRMDRQYL